MAENGYIGKISHGASQVVKAPQNDSTPKGNSTVKTGDDLRSGKK